MTKKQKIKKKKLSKKAAIKSKKPARSAVPLKPTKAELKKEFSEEKVYALLKRQRARFPDLPGDFGSFSSY